ncbi:MAG: nickel-dependent lactate racemase [Halanaerobiaceae bacterium]
MKLKYGEKELYFKLNPDKIAKILKAEEKSGILNPLQKMKESLEDPIGTPGLEELLQKKSPENIIIIVNDVSRPTPYEYMLPPLLAKIHKTGIKKEQVTFIIATGIHEPHDRQQNENVFGKELVENYEFVSHDPDDNLVKVDKLSSGNELYINKKVVKADFVITTGVILPHYFAGFSGGRKSILPGVAGRESIEFNHSRMVELIGDLPPIKENFLSNEMFEAAEKTGVDFIINVVTNSNREIVEIVAGDLKKAWYRGVEVSASMYQVSLKNKVEVAIVSAGGYPRDINLYQAQKALDHGDHGVKKGGTIIVIAECIDGLGEKTFARWINEAGSPEDNIERIKKKFELGGHKAFAISRVVQNKELILISSLDRETTESLFARKMDNIQDAINYVEKKYNNNYESIIMPQGGLTVPVLD